MKISILNVSGKELTVAPHMAGPLVNLVSPAYRGPAPTLSLWNVPPERAGELIDRYTHTTQSEPTSLVVVYDPDNNTAGPHAVTPDASLTVEQFERLVGDEH